MSLLKQQDVWEIFDRLKSSQDVQKNYGGTTPYSLLIEMMLEDEGMDFALWVAEKALAQSRLKNRKAKNDV